MYDYMGELQGEFSVRPRFKTRHTEPGIIVEKYTVLYADEKDLDLLTPRQLPTGWVRITQPAIIDGHRMGHFYVDYKPATLADDDFHDFKGDIPFGD
jgi:hypothetical protein